MRLQVVSFQYRLTREEQPLSETHRLVVLCESWQAHLLEPQNVRHQKYQRG